MPITFREVKEGLTSTYREGYKKRGIPLDICENDWEHTKWSTKACVAHLIGSPQRIQDKKSFPIMGLGHELVEWETDMKDYTPGCNITPKEKHHLESEVLNRLRINLSGKYSRILNKTGEYLDLKTSDAQEFFYIDKSLAGVGGLEYERLGYPGMEDFHPYALDKLSSDTYHTRIYKKLLEREFDHNFYEQYLVLLRSGGDENKFHSTLTQYKSLKNK